MARPVPDLKERFHSACKRGEPAELVDILRISIEVIDSPHEGVFPIHSVLKCPDPDLRFATMGVLFDHGMLPCCYASFQRSDQKEIYEKWFAEAAKSPRISERKKKTGITPLDLILFELPDQREERMAELFSYIKIPEAILLLEDARDFALAEGKDFLADYLLAMVGKISKVSPEQLLALSALDLKKRKEFLLEFVQDVTLTPGFVFELRPELVNSIKTFEGEGGDGHDSLKNVEIMRAPEIALAPAAVVPSIVCGGMRRTESFRGGSSSMDLAGLVTGGSHHEEDLVEALEMEDEEAGVGAGATAAAGGAGATAAGAGATAPSTLSSTPGFLSDKSVEFADPTHPTHPGKTFKLRIAEYRPHGAAEHHNPLIPSNKGTTTRR